MTFSNIPELAFGLASIGTGILSLLLAIAVFLGNPNLKENRIWALTSLSVAIWGGGLGMAILSPNERISLMWNQVFYTGGVWIPTTFVWFVSVFTRKPIIRTFLFVCFGISTILMCVLWIRIEWFVPDLVPRGPFRFWDILGPAYHVFTIHFFLCMGYSCLRLFRSIKTVSVTEQKKYRWIAIGIACGVIGGSTNFFYDYNVDIYPFGQFLVFLYPVLVSWAIIKYQAMDIGVLLKKTGFLLFIYFLLIALIIPIPIFIHANLAETLGSWPLLILFEIFIIAGVLSLGPFLYALVVQRGNMFRENTLAGLTHELKSPLVAIESALDMLDDRIKTQINPKDTSYFEMIERNSIRLKMFIDDLIQIFGNNQESRSLNINKVDIAGLVQEICNSNNALVKAKGISIEFQIGDPVIVLCDEKRIAQVVSNLISNAVKFTDKGKVAVRCNNDNGRVRVEVQDSGMGIGPDEKPYIFDRFFQGRGRNRSKGTGIGLTIARMWIEAHGGEIGVDSGGVGKGSRFWFTLPHQPGLTKY
ncbi:hypothetical protein BVX98_05110 [bacterium F11]|nr:hypothetical protein BVX98_05110 [bacterium F11]